MFLSSGSVSLVRGLQEGGLALVVLNGIGREKRVFRARWLGGAIAFQIMLS
jgi:hypothetical protein